MKIKTHDLVGIGFGPSNIGLAVALYDEHKKYIEESNVIFLEAKKKHGWHHSMMIPGAKMQISFMKDLCFLRNPRGFFTFVNYLKVKGRLSYFANLRDFNPTRKEFDDYLAWVASHFTDIVKYSYQVKALKPVHIGDKVEFIDIEVKNVEAGLVEHIRTRNISIAIGGEPVMPVELSENIFHSSNFLNEITRYTDDKPQRFLVVGSGQSAAEIYQYLIGHYKKSNVWVACSGLGFKQADDSEYVNEVFDSTMTSTIYDLSDESRDKLLNNYWHTNYSVVDYDVIKGLYREEYEQAIGSNEVRFGIKKFQKILFAETLEDGSICVKLKSTMTGEVSEIIVDVVICATGYSRNNNLQLLQNLESYMLDDKCSKLSRHYALRTTENFIPKIYVQGMSEDSHGISDTLLSVISKRSEEISRDLLNLSQLAI